MYLNGDCRLVKRSVVKRWKKTTYRPSLIGPIPVGLRRRGRGCNRTFTYVFLQLKPGSHWDLLMHFFLISWGSATGLQNGLQQPILKLGLLSISDCISDFKVRHKNKLVFYQDQSHVLRSFKVSKMFVWKFSAKFVFNTMPPSPFAWFVEIPYVSSNGAMGERKRTAELHRGRIREECSRPFFHFMSFFTLLHSISNISRWRKTSLGCCGRNRNQRELISNK